MGSDAGAKTFHDVLGQISIHAPTRGATLHPYGACLQYFISIHAPTRGATHLCSCYNRQMRFQSTPPHGERRYGQNCLQHNKQFQSTPPHGERPLSTVIVLNISLFQSTPPHGERRVCSTEEIIEFEISIHAPTRGATVTFDISTLKDIFQSTPPHGERLLHS